MIPVKDRNASMSAGSAIPLFTGDVYVNVPADWNTKGQIAVEQTYPMPANILCTIVRVNLGDTKTP
jgi:hypothetical protein